VTETHKSMGVVKGIRRGGRGEFHKFRKSPMSRLKEEAKKKALLKDQSKY